MSGKLAQEIEQIGLKKGEQIGLKKGEQIGEHKKAIEIAKNMKKRNMNIEFISETTGLSIKEIEKL